jgi:hypothetical protein
MPNENIKLNFAHICDLAFLSQNGKANIIGIFRTIYSPNFPVKHPKFSVITSFTVLNFVGKHKQTIKIIREEDKKEIGPIINVDFEVKDEKQELNFLGDIIGIGFEKPGNYSIKIFFDENEIYSIPFDVIKS